MMENTDQQAVAEEDIDWTSRSYRRSHILEALGKCTDTTANATFANTNNAAEGSKENDDSTTLEPQIILFKNNEVMKNKTKKAEMTKR